MTKRRNNLNPIVYFIVCLIAMILFDFMVTNHILHNIFLSEDFKFVDITYVRNTGAAFSSFAHATTLLIWISVIAVLGILYELFKDISKYTLPMYFLCAMLTAGIFCNTYERITLGYVRDFINLKFIDFPVFNISDILINLSVLAIIILIITKKYRRNAKTNIQN